MDTNSYRRKAEKYKRAIVEYEMRLENDFEAFLDFANTTDVADRRSALIDRAKRVFSVLRSNMKNLRGF